ncbi:ABC transporter substrate-binding protein [Candidatus Formimonas warabiya]|uniref:Leucine-binding protein domain-containing protein n=1 Tax=Formimonas warabiya TaxID=1761012 RepID=A0A3G1KZS9_FORW1|nr:ABC transporter substrate-binding protein [Candidatus Formimonas warabiya]ATW27901.1 hypothetical protein DCMF_26900 [Candidatus Formimonas warabiya]
MNKQKLFVITLIVIFALIALAGCGQKEATENGDNSTGTSADKIYIGWVAPLTGACANDGQQMQNGAQLAVNEINAAGGINGKQVELVCQDDKSDPKEAANIATKFVSDDRLVAVLGNYNSSCVLSGAPIYNEAKIPMVHVGTSPVITTEHGPYLFRISVTDAFQGEFVTKWLFEEGNKKPAILYENSDYGRGLMDTVEKQVASLGGTVADKETYELGQTKDFTGLLTKIKASGADSIFICGLYTEGALIAKQMQGLGISLPLFGTDGLYEQSLIDLAGQAAEGMKVSGLLLPSDPDQKIQDFVKNYQGAYGKVPGTYATFDYDAMNLLAQVITAAGADRQKIMDYLAKMPEAFVGVSGQVTFDENNDAVRTAMKKLTVKDGKWQIAE